MSIQILYTYCCPNEGCSCDDDNYCCFVGIEFNECYSWKRQSRHLFDRYRKFLCRKVGEFVIEQPPCTFDVNWDAHKALRDLLESLCLHKILIEDQPCILTEENGMMYICGVHPIDSVDSIREFFKNNQLRILNQYISNNHKIGRFPPYTVLPSSQMNDDIPLP